MRIACITAAVAVGVTAAAATECTGETGKDAPKSVADDFIKLGNGIRKILGRFDPDKLPRDPTIQKRQIDVDPYAPIKCMLPIL